MPTLASNTFEQATTTGNAINAADFKPNANLAQDVLVMDIQFKQG